MRRLVVLASLLVAAAPSALADVLPRPSPEVAPSFLLVTLAALLVVVWIGVRFVRRRLRTGRDGGTDRSRDA